MSRAWSCLIVTRPVLIASPGRCFRLATIRRRRACWRGSILAVARKFRSGRRCGRSRSRVSIGRCGGGWSGSIMSTRPWVRIRVVGWSISWCAGRVRIVCGSLGTGAESICIGRSTVRRSATTIPRRRPLHTVNRGSLLFIGQTYSSCTAIGCLVASSVRRPSTFCTPGRCATTSSRLSIWAPYWSPRRRGTTRPGGSS